MGTGKGRLVGVAGATLLLVLGVRRLLVLAVLLAALAAALAGHRSAAPSRKPAGR